MPIQTASGSMLTYEDYAAIPADRLRHEIIEGRHIVNPAPRPRHQGIQYKIACALQGLEDSHGATIYCAPIDLHLTEHDVVQPDLVVIAAASTHIIGELKIEGPPELVIEIFSPSTRRTDRGAKRALYEATGVLEYWIVDPEDTSVIQLSLVEGRYVEQVHGADETGSARTPASTAFPGFEVALDPLFVS